MTRSRVTLGDEGRKPRRRSGRAPALSLRWGAAEFVLWRQRMGWSAQRVSEVLGIHLTTVYRIGERDGPIEIPLQLACQYLEDALDRGLLNGVLDGIHGRAR